MEKWADYVIVAAAYKKERRHIERVKAHTDQGQGFGPAGIYPREQIVSAIEKGISFVTAYQKDGKYFRGNDVKVVILNNQKFIRTDGNSKEEDNLGELPELT